MNRPGPADPEMLAQRREEVRRLRVSGHSIGEIARVVGFSERVVSRDIAALGLAAPPGRQVTADDKARAEEMLADGMSVTAIAEALGIGQTTLNAHYRGRGWTPAQAGAFGMTVRRFNKIIDTTWKGIAS